jgi:hypothetical protein
MKYEKHSLEHLWKCQYDIEREQALIRRELLKLYKEMNIIYESLEDLRKMIGSDNYDQRMD